MSVQSQTDPFKTSRNILPYRFLLSVTGKLAIQKTNGQSLIVTRAQVENILKSDDLDVHRRRMYEAALEVFIKDAGQKQ